jgi:hypothetical protein
MNPEKTNQHVEAAHKAVTSNSDDRCARVYALAVHLSEATGGDLTAFAKFLLAVTRCTGYVPPPPQ